ncbi:MAG: hypothetical protein J7K40_09680 [candidate division Zixibacteria bacterium]|nr:hypothetical protein [candidate division Zixibacteria bacterium]
MNNDNLCIHPDYRGRVCWLSLLVDMNISLDVLNKTSFIQDNSAICHECEIFKKIMKKNANAQNRDSSMAATVINLVKQLSVKKNELEKTTDQLNYNINQLSLLKNLTDALARSNNLEKSMRIILAGATSGDTFCFNRAFIFLLNEKNNLLEGKSAVGPTSPEEAVRIWEKISKISLNRQLSEILIETEFIPCSLETKAAKIKLSVANNENPLIKVLNQSKEKVLDIKDSKYRQFDFDWLSPADKIVIVPIIAENRMLGLIIADNAISNKPITDVSVEFLKSLVFACAPGLQNAILYEKLRIKFKELERVHELYKSNQAYLVRHERLADIGTLATKVAHEFRIPLVTIGGYARRILKTLGSDKFDKHMVEVIISEVNRLSKITSEILEYSRVSKLDINKCNLNSVVTDSLTQLENKLNSSGINIEKIFNRKTLNIKADSERLKQVILNLIDNAVDAMQDGGKLTIKTSKNKEYVVLDIIDTGSGVDKYSLENLFNLFYTTKEKGSGLGLPVSKKIIDDHGGYINVESIPGKGTSFSVRLPAFVGHNKSEDLK